MSPDTYIWIGLALALIGVIIVAILSFCLSKKENSSNLLIALIVFFILVFGAGITLIVIGVENKKDNKK